MATPFEDIPYVPDKDELLDKSFSKAKRAAGSSSGIDAQRSMLMTSSNILHDNLEYIVTSFPSFDRVDDFYREIADAALGLDEIKQSLGAVDWASTKVKEIANETQREMSGGDYEDAIEARKRAFARMDSVLSNISDDLDRLGEARSVLTHVPEVEDHPTVVLAGYPNVGKSTFLESVTNAKPKIAEYPFTTKGVGIGHFERDYIRYQIVDTPGLLDRPIDDRNSMERQAVTALEKLADVVVFVLDPSEYCGYELGAQVDLLDEIRSGFDVPVVTVANKTDLYDVDSVEVEVEVGVDVDVWMSVEEGEGVDEALEAGLDEISSQKLKP
ncbi:MAG: GTPase [Halobacteria archaeon]|nr:GTPase [Halobacteria archaeon]